jgi:hypothetical protein
MAKCNDGKPVMGLFVASLCMSEAEVFVPVPARSEKQGAPESS